MTVGSIPTKGSNLKDNFMNDELKGKEEFYQLESSVAKENLEKNYFQDILSTEDCFPFDIEDKE